MTPYIGGDAVYSARVILGIDPDDDGMDYRFALQDNEQTTKNGVKIYPNPAKNSITIEFIKEENNFENAYFEIYGIIGNKLASIKLSNTINTVSTEQFDSGIYFYQVIENNKVIEKNKLILIK